MKIFIQSPVVILCLVFISQLHSEAGEVKDIPMTHKIFTETKDYFASRIAKKVYLAYKNNKVPSGWKVNAFPPEECVEYDQSKHSILTYIPDHEEKNEVFGLYVHVSAGASGVRPTQGWQKVMDKMNLIYISPHKTQNGLPSWRRIVLALDSIATIKKMYKIDTDRIYIGGISGGGHVAMMCQMIYPEYFQAALSHAAQSYLPVHFPGLSMSDVKKKPRRNLKWAVISGDKDYNYQEILETGKVWKRAKFQYRFFDVKGMGHTNAPAEALEEALIWAGASFKKKKPLVEHHIRTWTSAGGTSLQAKLVESKNGIVILKKASGTRIKVPVEKLSQKDRDYVQSLVQE